MVEKNDKTKALIKRRDEITKAKIESTLRERSLSIEK